MTDNKTVRTRMAPSPTGEYHVGHIATLLKNYAFAKKHGGKFVLRIEDTDRVRYTEGAVDKILQVIRDYGLDWDEGPDKGGPFAPYTQSERLDIYQEKAQELIKKNQAYYCFCSKERLEEVRDQQRANKQPPKYDRHCLNLSQKDVETKLAAGESFVIRLRVPDDKQIKFTDLLRGEITVNSNEVDDQVLVKSDGFPTYHLAVVTDDHLMKISHILRGEEWISSTPKHALLYQAFGWQPPIYAHIPVFLNPDGKGKMSKRKGTVSAQSFLDQGYLPEAMLNFFMILGWAPDDQREILSLDEYVGEFDPENISTKSVVFDFKKLRWMNGVYIRKLNFSQLKQRIKPFLPNDFPKEKLDLILPLVQERLETLAQLEELTQFFYRDIELDRDTLLKKTDQETVLEQLDKTQESLSSLTKWSVESVEKAIRSLQEDNNWEKGQYFMMLRLAVTGRKISPPLFETIHALGLEITRERLAKAHQLVA
ncbi:glutamate--tRNA ligase [Patescibacteria group bacterium]|nr:glutamate--tRNA ligase [Patescibacteria group bacterium]MBU1966828.1 glutamate--tRNA ligase [Patescibacteria group bacterium]MBU2543822.1 glutamate--tRNA ligase [Patescibacteria group bacterium]